MNPVKCPICQELAKPVDIYSDGLQHSYCANHGPNNTHTCRVGFWYAVDTDGVSISYDINLEIDGNMYGYDSESMNGRSQTRIYYIRKFKEVKHNGPIFKSLITFPTFTPLQENIQLYEREIKRIINLKAFL